MKNLGKLLNMIARRLLAGVLCRQTASHTAQ
jgi:hypothetical protein